MKHLIIKQICIFYKSWFFFIKDKRYHIVEELYRNEQEYVDALSTLKDVSLFLGQF